MNEMDRYKAECKEHLAEVDRLVAERIVATLRMMGQALRLKDSAIRLGREDQAKELESDIVDLTKDAGAILRDALKAYRQVDWQVITP
jgi:hypothetical protein